MADLEEEQIDETVEVESDEVTENADEEAPEVDVETDTTEEDTDTKEAPKEAGKPKQNADERKRFAQMRREREAKEREEAEHKAYQKGVIQGLGGINPYTNQKIEDDFDFELYKEMKACEEKGYDPSSINDLSKYRKEVMQEEKQKAQKVEDEKVNITNDIKSFQDKYKDVNVNELLENEPFVKFSNDLIGKVPLSSIYEKFLLINNQAEEKAKQIALKKEARRQVSTGSLTNEAEVDDYYSLEELSKMSREDISANWEKVQRSHKKYMN